MSLKDPLLGKEKKRYIQYISTGIAFESESDVPNPRVLASYIAIPRLSKLITALEHVFINNCKRDKSYVEMYSFEEGSNGYTSHYFINEDGLFAFSVTTVDYVHRCANRFLEEALESFLKNFKKKLKNKRNLKEFDLSNDTQPLFASLVEKYEDVEGIDALCEAEQKVDKTKSVMSDNISLLLENQDCAERVLQQSEDLNRDAAVFKRNTNKLKFKMLCRSRKV